MGLSRISIPSLCQEQILGPFSLLSYEHQDLNLPWRPLTFDQCLELRLKGTGAVSTYLAVNPGIVRNYVSKCNLYLYLDKYFC